MMEKFVTFVEKTLDTDLSVWRENFKVSPIIARVIFLILVWLLSPLIILYRFGDWLADVRTDHYIWKLMNHKK